MEKFDYLKPTIEVVEISVEQGIAESLLFGKPGTAGDIIYDPLYDYDI